MSPDFPIGEQGPEPFTFTSPALVYSADVSRRVAARLADGTWFDDGPYTYRIRCAIYAAAAFVGVALGCVVGYYTT
jgi:hypothetical protein